MRVLVISPVFGGAFPIAESCVSALIALGHEATLVDLRSFQSRYHQLREEAQSDEEAGALFYREVQGELERLVASHTPDIFFSMALVPLREQFVQMLRKRGIITASWFVEDCERFPMWRWQAGWFDYFFIIQKEPFLQQVKDAGASAPAYLPNAGDGQLAELAELSQSERTSFGSDICFMGAPYPNRVLLFSELSDFSVGLWGRGWSDYEAEVPGMVREGRRLISPPEEASIYRSSKILVNVHSSTTREESGGVQDFLNPRTFTAAMCGIFQLVDERSLLAEEFSIGTEVETFSDREDLKKKLRYYLERPEERAAIALAAKERALRDHSYEVRIAQALAMMGVG